MTRSTRILMVCMGNVCRSPTAEVVLRHRTAQAGIGDQVQVDSAGTHASNNAARPPDERSVAHAARRGYDLRAVRARRVVAEDFERFDLIIGMDEDNLANLRSACPQEHRHKLKLLMGYASPDAPGTIPDPYYGGGAGFEWVLDLVEAGCDGLVESLLRQSGLESR